jgi:beta-aspartyl-peptidase (threonine type)
MDAAIMDGQTLNVGAVAALARVRNPIQLARHILTTEHVLVVGNGAEEIAAKLDLPMCHPLELVVERELERWRRVQADPTFAIADAFRAHDTVGALALDEQGNIAAAISTGGVPNKLPGRVGDAPLVGCGFYADNEIGACCATGLGEAIMRVVLSKGVVDHLGQGLSAQNAAQTAIENMARRTSGAAGCIVLHRDGSVGIAHNTPRMAFAHRRTGTEPIAAIAYTGN